MEMVNTDTTIIDGYIKLLEGLSPASKLDLIARLTASVNWDIASKKPSFEKAFGAWRSEESAEELIDTIRNSRTFTRQIEAF